MENDSKTMSADNWGQIIRKDARGCFVEIKNDCFHLEKVHLQFVSYHASSASSLGIWPASAPAR